MVKLDLLSHNLVEILNICIANEGIGRLLVYDDKGVNPMSTTLTAPTPSSLMFTKVHPFPFDPNAQIEDEVFLRIYFADGDFESRETWVNPTVHFDIICAKSMWLYNDGKSRIRPYEIMGRIVDMISSTGSHSIKNVKFERFAHLPVNDRFDAIRLYASMHEIL